MIGRREYRDARTVVRQIVALVVLVIAGVATLATQPAAPNAEASVDTSIVLDAERPIAVIRVRVTVEEGDVPLTHAVLSVRDDDDWNAAPVKYWLTILPEDRTELIRYPREGSFGPFFYGEALQDLLPVCMDGCVRSYLIVARAADPDRALRPAFSVEVDLYEDAQANRENAAPARASVIAEPLPERGSSAFVRASVAGQLNVDGGRGSSSWSGRLTLPAGTLPENAVLVHGGIWVEGTVDGTDEDTTAHLVLTIDGVSQPPQFVDWHRPLETISAEWDSRCVPGQLCELPVKLDLRWPPCLLLFCSERQATKTVDFKLEARLEYLEQAAVPPGARLDLVVDE